MADVIPGGYNDPDAEGNGLMYLSGRTCIEKECENPAGTAWSPLWCFPHSVERIDRITAQLKELRASFE